MTQKAQIQDGGNDKNRLNYILIFRVNAHSITRYSYFNVLLVPVWGNVKLI